MTCQACRYDLLCRETQTPEMGKILAAVMVGHNPGRVLEDLDSSVGHAPQLETLTGTLGLSKKPHKVTPIPVQ